MLRDEETEGYSIIPNFFISAQQRDLKMHSEITWIDRKDNKFTSCQFHNRVFDRDTLLVAHYDVNFLYVVALYGRKNEGMKAAWRESVRKRFRREIQTMLDYHFQFHILTPREHVNGKRFLQEHFQDVIGKVFQPYPESESGQRYYSLALEKPETISDPLISKKVDEENKRLIELLDPYFDRVKCNIGEDKRNELIKYVPNAVSYDSEDMVLLITKEGRLLDQTIEKLEETNRVGVALQMDGAVLRLVEGFTKAKYLVIHNKSDKQYAYKIVGKGPELIPGGHDDEMVVTKKDADLYLSYIVDSRQRVSLGELDLTEVKKGGEGYMPQLLPLSKLVMKSHG